MALAQYSELFWFPSGELAADVPARVFQHASNTLATLWADAGGTTPLANPLSTSETGRLEFWAEDGKYWIHADSEAFEVAVGGATESATQQDITDAVGAEAARADAAYAVLAHAARHAGAGADAVTLTVAQITGLAAALGALLPRAGGVISGSLAVTGHALGEDKPAAHGAAAWCYPPAQAVNTTELTNGRLYLVRVNIDSAVTVSKIYWWVGNSGSGPVAGQCRVGLYDSAGTLLAAATVDADISSAGLKTTTIPAQALAAGNFYWIGLLFNASVSPSLTRGSGWTGVEAAANVGQAPATFQYATNGTGRTVMPSSIIPASNTGTDFAGPWAAVSA